MIMLMVLMVMVVQIVFYNSMMIKIMSVSLMIAVSLL